MTAYVAVLLYMLWIVALVLLYAGPRIPQALMGAKPIDSWERNKTPSDPPFFQRVKGAHLNCLENLPLFLGVVVMAALMNRVEVVNSIAAYVLYARVAQGLVHMMGTSFVLIMARATFFLVQTALIAYAAVMLVMG